MKKGNNKNRRRAAEGILYMVFPVMLLLCFLTSCGDTEKTDAGIGIRLVDYSTEKGVKVQIPEFYSEDEKLQQSLRDLERETGKLRRIYEKAQKNNEFIEMRCYVGDTEVFPQVTVVWYVVEEETRTYNLVTLCADEKEGLSITCREALERTGISGVDLSLQVGKLAQEADLRGQISSMEMQGFKIDDTGVIREIYMKLLMEIEKEGETVQEEHFFSYIPEENRLVSLPEKGFDVP